jgi:hypothetical protein
MIRHKKPLQLIELSTLPLKNKTIKSQALQKFKAADIIDINMVNENNN